MKKDFVLDIDKLKTGLDDLTGNDFCVAEKIARANGDMTPIISMSGVFQAQLAAKALACSTAELKSLKIKDYTAVINTVTNFLFTSSAEMLTPAEN